MALSASRRCYSLETIKMGPCTMDVRPWLCIVIIRLRFLQILIAFSINRAMACPCTLCSCKLFMTVSTNLTTCGCDEANSILFIRLQRSSSSISRLRKIELKFGVLSDFHRNISQGWLDNNSKLDVFMSRLFLFIR